MMDLHTNLVFAHIRSDKLIAEAAELALAARARQARSRHPGPPGVRRRGASRVVRVVRAMTADLGMRIAAMSAGRADGG
jgi:hypothetical protein